MFLLSIRVTIIVYIIILRIFFSVTLLMRKVTVPSTIPTEPEVLIKPDP